jgi:hypothetical protein
MVPWLYIVLLSQDLFVVNLTDIFSFLRLRCFSKIWNRTPLPPGQQQAGATEDKRQARENKRYMA